MLRKSDTRYYGGGRGGFTSRGGGHTGDGQSDRYHGGGRGGFTVSDTPIRTEDVTPAPAPAADAEPKRKP